MTASERRTMQNPPIDLKRRGGGVYKLGSRRARAACALCRWRKVRCDAEEGQRCSNCVFEDVQCVLLQKQRRKKPSSEAGPLVTDNLAREVSECATSRTAIVDSPESEELQRRTSPLANGDKTNVIRTAQPERSCELNSGSIAPEQGTDSFDWQDIVNQSLPPPVSPNPLIGVLNATMTFSDIERSLSRHSIPRFVKAFPPHLGSEDVEYLQRKGALTVPERDLRDELLRCYIDFIHPCLPVIDLQAFQASIEDPERNGRVSFPLFQAVMFAGLAWVDIKPLRRLGYLTRKAARKAFFLRARLLYDADYEQDRTCIIQTLLLLSLWWEGPNEQKDGWYWSGLALSVAKTIGLNRDTNSDCTEPVLRRLRRQLWWCCFMRDTIASFAFNRVPRVRDCDYSVPMLSLDDFDICEPTSPETLWAVQKDVKTQKQLAIICIGMVKICHIISKILQVAYDENPVGQIGTLYSDQELNASESKPASNTTLADIHKLRLCEEELLRWKEETPAEALHQSPTPDVSLLHEQATLLHRAMLSMLYYVAILSLHKPRILTDSFDHTTEQNTSSNGQNSSRRMIRNASALTNKIVMDLYQADLMRLLPATGISCLIPVSISHVLDMKSSDENTRRDGFQRLEECKQALGELADTHIAAQWAINFLTFVASRVPRAEKFHPGRTETGEIKRNFQSQPQLAGWVQAITPPSEESNSLPNEPSDMIGAFDLAAFNPSRTQGFFPASFDKQLGNPADSTEDFSNTINFSEMWLSFAGSSDSMLNMDWIDH